MIKRVFPVLAISVFASMLGAGIIAPLLPLYAEKMGATGIWIGIVFASFSVSRALIMPIAGRLSDRHGRKVFLSIGLLSYSIISLGYIWASNVLQLTLVRVIQGAAGGMIIPIAQACVGDISPEGEEGTWMGYFNAAFFTGFGCGPLMGGALTDRFGMTVAFSGMGVLNLLAFLVVIFFLPEIERRKTAASHQLSFRKMGSSAMIKGIFSFRLAFSLGRGTYAAFLPIFAATCIGLSPTLIGIVLAVNILVMSLLGVYGGNIADRFNRRLLVILGSFINIAFLISIPFTHSFRQLLTACALGGIGGAISVPAASALTVEEGRKFGMASTIAIFTTAMSVGMAAGPLLSGIVVDLARVDFVFYLGAGMGLVGISLFAWFTR
jgi:MFS family permease